MNSKFTTPLFITILGVLIAGGYYFLQTVSMHSFYPKQTQTKNMPSIEPTKTTSILDGQYVCTVSIPTSAPIAIEINQGKAHASIIAKSGDHIEGVFDKNVLYVWDQGKQQGTKFTNVANTVIQMISQNSSACKKTTFSDASQFTIPNFITFKENTSNNPLEMLQALQ